MKKANKIISVLLVLAMLLTMVPLSLTASAASGTCGEKANWSLNKGVLTISGSGDMTDYESEDPPWYGEIKNIRKVVVESGITRIGKYSFYNHSGLQTVEIKGKPTIYNYAFAYCNNLTDVVYGGTVDKIYYSAFQGCSSNFTLTMPECLGKSKDSFAEASNMKVKLVDANGNDKTDLYYITLITQTSSQNNLTIQANLEKGSISAIPDQIYTGSAVTPAVTVKWNGKTVSSSNYNLVYNNNVEEGTATVTVKGEGDYARTLTQTFKIFDCKHEGQVGICSVCGKNLHNHAYNYTANSNVITATCSNSDGACLNTNGGTLKISAPADLYADGTTAKEATVENNLVDTSVAVSGITYSSGSAPKTAGTYTASVAVGGVTATVEYTLVKRNAAADMFVFSAPANLVYDGTPKYATVEVSPEITGMGAVNVTYYKDGAAVDPVNAGTYTVKVSTAESDKYYALTDVELGSFAIGKKPITATATAPDKQYNGIGNIDKSKITIVLDGIVDGESVETAVETAWIEGEAVGENYLVPVFFSVSGDAAKNYSFPMNELYPTEFYYAEATVNIYNDFTPKKGTEYTVNSNDWINTDFVITAKEGYQLSLDNELNGWSDILSKSEETENGSITFYVMNKETGAISLAATENYKIDKTMPHGYFSDSHGRGYDYLLLDEIQTEPYYENEDIFTHKYEAWDDASGIANMEYYFSTTKLTKAELDCVSGWTEFDLDIDIEDIFEFPGDETYSYIRVTDNAGNIIYYVAHLVYDSEMAKINGVLYGFTYYTTQIISVTDNFKLDYATVNGEVVKSGYDAITLAGNCDATYEIFTYDLAENPRAEAIITMKPIATLSEPIDNLKEETIKSSDKETIEAVKAEVEKIDTTDATDDEKDELQKILDKCDALIKKIADIQAEIDRLGKTVASYTEENVKSTDKADLEQLKADIQALIDNTNTTENEKTALEEMIKDIEALEGKIAETEEKLEEIKGIENNFNPETVTSDDKAAIEEKIAEIENVNSDNLTEEQKAEYDEIKVGFEALLEEIEKAGSEVDSIGAELEMFGENRVTIFWEDEIEALKAKIDELLADENMGEAEKARLNEYKAQCDNLIEIINTPAKYFSMRLFHFVWDALHWLSSHVVFIFNWIIAMF